MSNDGKSVEAVVLLTTVLMRHIQLLRQIKDQIERDIAERRD